MLIQVPKAGTPNPKYQREHRTLLLCVLYARAGGVSLVGPLQMRLIRASWKARGNACVVANLEAELLVACVGDGHADLQLRGPLLVWLGLVRLVLQPRAIAVLLTNGTC